MAVVDRAHGQKVGHAERVVLEAALVLAREGLRAALLAVVELRRLGEAVSRAGRLGVSGLSRVGRCGCWPEGGRDPGGFSEAPDLCGEFRVCCHHCLHLLSERRELLLCGGCHVRRREIGV